MSFETRPPVKAPEETKSRAKRPSKNRIKLLEVARRLFGEKGYAETGTEEIVAAAGITRGALYYQFADKEDLFRAVFEASGGMSAFSVSDSMPNGSSVAQGSFSRSPFGRLWVIISRKTDGLRSANFT